MFGAMPKLHLPERASLLISTRKGRLFSPPRAIGPRFLPDLRKAINLLLQILLLLPRGTRLLLISIRSGPRSPEGTSLLRSVVFNRGDLMKRFIKSLVRTGQCGRCGDCCAGCKDLKALNICRIYKKRPKNCRNYPSHPFYQKSSNCAYHFFDTETREEVKRKPIPHPFHDDEEFELIFQGYPPLNEEC